MFAILFTLLLIYDHFTEAEVRITYSVKNYANKDNMDIRLRKCEAFSFLGDNCDPIFQFTAYTTNARGERVVTMKREVGPFRNTRFIKKVLETSQIQEVFPETIEFELDIHDSDADDDQQIALFTRKISVTKTGTIELRLGADVHVDVIIEIQCADGYYGNRCQTYCRPYSGLWTCHEVTGSRVCAKPCVHGSCVLTSTSAVCVCASGWTGEFCKVPTDSSVISSIILPEMPPSSAADASMNEEERSDTEVLSNVYLPPSASAQVTDTSERPTPYEIESSSPSSGEEIHITNHAMENESIQPIIPESESKLKSIVDETSSNATQNSREHHYYQESSAQNGSLSEINDSVITQAGGYSSHPSSIYIIVLTTISVIIIWAIVFAIIALVIYRRRKGIKGSNHSGSLWTNASYDVSPVTFIPSHAYKDDSATSPMGSLRLSPNTSSNINMPRFSLPKVPTLDSDGHETIRYTALPVHSASRIRFAPPKANPLPPAPKDIPCMTLTDPYDELTYLGEDYAPLTSLH